MLWSINHVVAESHMITPDQARHQSFANPYVRFKAGDIGCEKEKITLLRRQNIGARCCNCSVLPGVPAHTAALRPDTGLCRTAPPSPGPPRQKKVIQALEAQVLLVFLHTTTPLQSLQHCIGATLWREACRNLTRTMACSSPASFCMAGRGVILPDLE